MALLIVTPQNYRMMNCLKIFSPSVDVFSFNSFSFFILLSIKRGVRQMLRPPHILFFLLNNLTIGLGVNMRKEETTRDDMQLSCRWHIEMAHYLCSSSPRVDPWAFTGAINCLVSRLMRWNGSSMAIYGLVASRRKLFASLFDHRICIFLSKIFCYTIEL